MGLLISRQKLVSLRVDSKDRGSEITIFFVPKRILKLNPCERLNQAIP